MTIYSVHSILSITILSREPWIGINNSLKKFIAQKNFIKRCQLDF
jgi:hypothetical protein